MSVSRLTKLKAMRPGEIVHRLAYGAYTTLERQAHARGKLAPANRLHAALLPEIASRTDWKDVLARRDTPLFPWERNPEALRQVFIDAFAEELSRSRAIADRVLHHEVSFFGETFALGEAIDWHADPVTGAQWPRRYHRDVPVHGGNVGFGDVKHVWELNRHQFLVDLAKIAFLENSRRHADAAHAILRSWHASVPYATGAAWACALEPAFRASSWLFAYHLLRAAGAIDRDDHLLWLTGLYDHARFLHRHLEHYSSPFNHLIGEAATLFMLGMLLPEFREAHAWERRGRHVLTSTLSGQFHSDGGSVEQSTFYHHATLGFYLLSDIVARRAGRALPGEVRSAMERGLEFSIALMQPDGRLPRIGGADDGKPIRFEHLRFWDFRPYYAIGAVEYSRRDFRFAAGRFWEDALWLLGPDGSSAFDRLEPEEPPRTAAFPASGYYVARNGWSPSADYLCFDCGEQAAGLRRDDVPSAAHGHADCLSIVAVLGGREVLVDPGFFCYNGDPAWEVYFRKTLAHNTIGIDGMDQALHVSKMAWARTFAARPDGWSVDGPLAWARGSHDGYARRADAVTHRRTAWLRPDGYLVIYDELTVRGAHAARAVFQFGSGDLVAGDSSALFEGRYELAWTCSAPVTAHINPGGDGPAGGWIATSLGVRQRAARLVLEFPANERTALLTVLADTARNAGVPGRLSAVSFVEQNLLGIRVTRGELADDIVAAVEGAVTLPELVTDAPLVVVRRRDGRAVEAAQAGGTRVAVDPEARGNRGRLRDAPLVVQ
jgi:hypothetical protein